MSNVVCILFGTAVFLFMIFMKLDKILDVLKDIRAHVEANEENEE